MKTVINLSPSQDIHPTILVSKPSGSYCLIKDLRKHYTLIVHPDVKLIDNETGKEMGKGSSQCQTKGCINKKYNSKGKLTIDLFGRDEGPVKCSNPEHLYPMERLKKEIVIGKRNSIKLHNMIFALISSSLNQDNQPAS